MCFRDLKLTDPFEQDYDEKTLLMKGLDNEDGCKRMLVDFIDDQGMDSITADNLLPRLLDIVRKDEALALTHLVVDELVKAREHATAEKTREEKLEAGAGKPLRPPEARRENEQGGAKQDTAAAGVGRRMRRKGEERERRPRPPNPRNRLALDGFLTRIGPSKAHRPCRRWRYHPSGKSS